MEIEGLFSSGKWSIIELLASQESSPLQLSQALGTSVANVSQQLKLLELLGLVSTRRVPNRERGKPRTFYSISQDYVMVISALRNFAKKSFIKATPMHSSISRILCYPNQELHYPLMKLFWTLEPQLASVEALIFDEKSSTMLVVSSKPGGLKLQGEYTFKHKSGDYTFHIRMVKDFKSNTLSQGQYPIYDPEHILKSEVKEK